MATSTAPQRSRIDNGTLRTSITSGTYTLAIVNLGPGSESGERTYEIFLTR
jgi:hypothetical protein